MRYYVADAFTDQVFGGNPAGVCLLGQPLDAVAMQKIAFENNLSETAFLVKQDGYYDLKWFSPEMEIDLCGHATLASAFVLMSFVERGLEAVDFKTVSGKLSVRREGDLYVLDLPSRRPSPCSIPDGLAEALGVPVLETQQSRDLIVLLESEDAVRHLKPDLSRLASSFSDTFAFVVTAEGTDCDFVSRFFAPNAGIPEDPVTGSSHATLTPFWSQRLGKTEMTARQLSRRGGRLTCRDLGERVEVAGKAVLYLEGTIKI